MSLSRFPLRTRAGSLRRRWSRVSPGPAVQLNITAILAEEQVAKIARALSPGVASFVSVFAGRIADTGVDPVPVIARSLELLRGLPRAEVIWASPRELLNVFQADAVGCDVITATADVLNKLSLVGKNLTAYSLETVEMFREDALAAGYTIPVSAPVREGVSLEVP